MAEGLSAVAVNALPRAIASGSWFGKRKPTAPARSATRLMASTQEKTIFIIFTTLDDPVALFNLFCIILFLHRLTAMANPAMILDGACPTPRHTIPLLILTHP